MVDLAQSVERITDRHRAVRWGHRRVVRGPLRDRHRVLGGLRPRCVRVGRERRQLALLAEPPHPLHVARELVVRDRVDHLPHGPVQLGRRLGVGHVGQEPPALGRRDVLLHHRPDLCLDPLRGLLAHGLTLRLALGPGLHAGHLLGAPLALSLFDPLLPRPLLHAADVARAVGRRAELVLKLREPRPYLAAPAVRLFAARRPVGDASRTLGLAHARLEGLPLGHCRRRLTQTGCLTHRPHRRPRLLRHGRPSAGDRGLERVGVERPVGPAGVIEHRPRQPGDPRRVVGGVLLVLGQGVAHELGQGLAAPDPRRRGPRRVLRSDRHHVPDQRRLTTGTPGTSRRRPSLGPLFLRERQEPLLQGGRRLGQGLTLGARLGRGDGGQIPGRPARLRRMRFRTRDQSLLLALLALAWAGLKGIGRWLWNFDPFRPV